ncbi:MAG: nucleotidyltransferase family protein [Polyangiaceae bacterium]
MRELADAVDVGELRRAARANKIEALVGVGLREACAGVLPGDWEQALAENARRVERLLSAAASCSVALGAAGIPCALIEGGGTLLGSDLPLEAYGAGDFDFLVPESAWPQVPGVMADLGYLPKDRRSRPTYRVEFCREDDDRYIEIGSRPFDRMWLPLLYRDRSPEWLRQRIPSKRRPELHVLAPTDHLLQVCFHTSLHSYVRSPGVRLHVDVDRTVRDNAIDWTAFNQGVRAMGIARRAFFSLWMAKDLLDTPIPGEVLVALSPGRIRRLLVGRLLAEDGVLANGRPKLTRGRTIALDMMLEAKGLARWFINAALPPEAWLRDHFERGDTARLPLALLHLQRYRSALGEWRPGTD